MSIRNAIVAGLAAVAGLFAANAAQAQSTTVPGEQVGLATGAPLPEGIYALNTFTYRRTDQPFSADTAVNVPVLVWSTPLVLLNGRVELLVAPPTVFAFSRNRAGVSNRDISINVGTFVGGIWAFDLGSNFGVSLLGGVYLNDLDAGRGSLFAGQFNPNGTPIGTPILPQLASNTYRAGIAASYTGDGYNLTANLTGNFYDSPGRFPGQIGNAIGPIRISDALNLDLTATKRFGKFEIGAVGYGTVNLDISQFSAAAGNRGRFALGGLIGYDFGIFTAQLYVARDVATGLTYTNALGATRQSYSTDGWFRIVAPLYTAPTAAAAPLPLVRKY